ncbi:hypothetical protein LTR91_010898 [Friedmanniomyces endolithicus]|uniref:RRM domain-containing protein n=1 Tax=Friedmanniomyces endolithicus TaxID=329885 RepID=A0AAN6QT28_9PEZI|nr:hypothetical protein LTR75_016312 [Friedmanniomyces endolithicus]KAK0883071.1 hypothetical protein LTR87_003064 [Friedmanniomyces endolithicus]KAK0927109.1 hypothetical protein LTR57_003716 [Friedmanniomyces endolithicus]KAK0984354.1 hypothetical protein LTR91_010898 [Friedmanniomyces endolithicus]KAK0997490.1 hypothetical protein LTS01_006000 [Friedmanniomyces endolithicus]
MSDNTANINASGAVSKSPSGGKPNGGVALPLNPKLRENVAVAVPLKPKMESSRGAGVCGVNKPGSAATSADVAVVKKLSADASAFKPGQTKALPCPITLLNKNSTADTPVSAKPITADDQPIIVTSANPKHTNGVGEGKIVLAAQQPIGTRSASRTPPLPTVYFTTDVGPMQFPGGHYLKIDGLTTIDLKEWNKTMSELDISKMLRGMKLASSPDSSRFTYFCCFDDIRETTVACEFIEMAQTGWHVKYISQTEYAGAPEGETSSEKSSYHDGQVLFVAAFSGPTADFVAKGANEAVHTLAGTFGEMRAFAQVTSATWPDLEFRAEYYKITDAKKALAATPKESPHTVDNWKVIAKELAGYTVQAVGAAGANDAAVSCGMTAIRIVGTPPLEGDVNGSNNFTSPTGRTGWRINEKGEEEPIKPMRILPKVGSVPFGVSIAAYVGNMAPQLAGPPRDRYNSAPTPNTQGYNMYAGDVAARSGSWNGNEHDRGYSQPSPSRGSLPGPQAVELWKIDNGQDVRTTVMLRNIPNRMTCRDLKQVLDENCHGMYDFSYLRIDFEKGTNVGYAFVNFADPVGIAPFVRGHAGKRWQAGNARRVELSYATVQGYDCLVEKFRNSAIMSEYSEYRPKLWYTFMNAPQDTLVGEEAPFPGPNNLSKKQRSLDNAGQIGLYAPRSCHINRERGRHSQWDRGNSYQISEDERYFEHMSPMQNGQYGNGHYNGPNGYAPNGYNMGMRMTGPPPHFQQVAYGNGYGPNPYHGQFNQFGSQQFGYGSTDGGDGFAHNYHGGYPNNHPGSQFGTGPGNPASRLRTQTNGKLGGRPGKVTNGGGPVKTPGGYGSYGAPDGHYTGPTPKVLTEEDIAGGYNNTPGPHYYPKY